MGLTETLPGKDVDGEIELETIRSQDRNNKQRFQSLKCVDTGFFIRKFIGGFCNHKKILLLMAILLLCLQQDALKC